MRIFDPGIREGGGEAKRLSVRIARRSLVRLRRARRALVSPRRRARLPQAGPVFEILAATLRTLPREARVRILTGPDVRGFLSEAETWIEVRRLAVALLATRGRGRRGAPAGGRRGHARLQARLLDRVSRTQHLVTLVPRGRIDPGFAARCLRFARLRLADATFDLAALVLGLRLHHPRPDRLSLVLRFREDAEQGRPRQRVDLGTIAGPAGPLAIEFTGNRGAAPDARRKRAHARRPPPRLRATLRGTTLTLSAPGAGSVVIPAAGTRLLAPDLGPRPRGGGSREHAAAFRLVRRALVPGTSIVLSPVVVSSPRRLRVTREAPGLGRRLARALRIVLVVWPEAHREIGRRTFMVVPIREPGTVSYSMAARPGISFINVFGKSIVDLADDLLHETAHHRLHDLQETTDLLRRGPETLEVQAFDSPWRGTRRPLHGILHGAYTFLFRAELFSRIVSVARAHPRLLAAELGTAGPAFVHREWRREVGMIRAALRDLRRAERERLLTPAGVRLLVGMESRFRGLRRD